MPGVIQGLVMFVCSLVLFFVGKYNAKFVDICQEKKL